MNVSAEQCPEPIQRFLAPAECMKCGTKPGSGLAVRIRYQPPMYFGFSAVGSEAVGAAAGP